MTDAAAFSWRQAAAPSTADALRAGRPGIALWSASVLLVLLCHAVIAWTLLASRDRQQPLPAIMMDLAPPVASPAVPEIRLPMPQPPQVQPVSPPNYHPVQHPPAPQLKAMAPDLPQIPAQAALPPPPKKPAKPPAKPQPDKLQPDKLQPAKALSPKPETIPAPQPASRTLPASAPAALPAPTQNAAQQQQASAAAAVAAKSNWLGDVVQHIARFKRVPRARLRMSLRAVIGFEINRDGKLLSQHLLQSSGRDDIDREALAWIRRADPLPKPPREISDGDLSHGFTIPVDFMPR